MPSVPPSHETALSGMGSSGVAMVSYGFVGAYLRQGALETTVSNPEDGLGFCMRSVSDRQVSVHQSESQALILQFFSVVAKMQVK